jgi:hypothetical protein
MRWMANLSVAIGLNPCVPQESFLVERGAYLLSQSNGDMACGDVYTSYQVFDIHGRAAHALPSVTCVVARDDERLCEQHVLAS